MRRTSYSIGLIVVTISTLCFGAVPVFANGAVPRVIVPPPPIVYACKTIDEQIIRVIDLEINGKNYMEIRQGVIRKNLPIDKLLKVEMDMERSKSGSEYAAVDIITVDEAKITGDVEIIRGGRSVILTGWEYTTDLPVELDLKSCLIISKVER